MANPKIIIHSDTDDNAAQRNDEKSAKPAIFIHVHSDDDNESANTSHSYDNNDDDYGKSANPEIFIHAHSDDDDDNDADNDGVNDDIHNHYLGKYHRSSPPTDDNTVGHADETER